MVWRGFSAFRRNKNGNVAMLWALIGGALIGLVGLTVDFTRAEAIRTQLQNAADGAALAAARAPATTNMADRTAAARAYFESEAGDLAVGTTFSLSEIGENSYRVNLQTSMDGGLTNLISNQNWGISVNSEAEQGGVNMEVALVLDTTGSMDGSKIAALRQAATTFVDTIVQDQQTPFYSKVALVTYSVGVNAGPYAAAVRGAIPPARSITGAAWTTGSARTVSGATRTNPVVVTANSHGFTDGQTVYLSGIRGMTQINNRYFRVDSLTANTFELEDAITGANINGSSYSAWSSGGTQRARRCQTARCEVVVTSNAHGFSEGANVFITGVGGMTQINRATGSGTGTTWPVSVINSNSFALTGSTGPSYSSYTSGGSAFCTTYGCEYYRFTNASGTTNVFRASTCTTERTINRTGANAYTDVAPSTALLGLNYPSTATNGACPTNTVLPMTSNRSSLNSRISALTASGYTAGHIGAAWGWYMLSPNFGLWTGEGQPSLYRTPDTVKFVVLMTDGEFNAVYCNGVIARDAPGAGNNVDHENCDAENDRNGLNQAQNLCAGMRAEGIIVATVAFDISNATTRNELQECASEGWTFTADDPAQLADVFADLAARLSQLRITH